MKVLKKVGGFVLGAVGAVIGFVVAGPVGAAIGFSVGMGIGTAVQMAAMRTKVPDVSSATTQRLNVSIDPDANRKIAFGETALGTDQVYWETWGPESSYYDQVIAAAGHEIESFGKLYFDDEEVTFSGNTATGAYAGALTKADRTVGVSGTALTVGAGTKWTSACSMTGVAHYALRIQWSQEKFPRGIPSRVTRVGKGAKVYDPRRDSTRGGSGSHRADDQSTWEYTPVDSNGQPIGRNPALQILWYEIGWRVTNPSTSEQILTCGRGRPLDDIDFASFITAANDCEDEGYYSDVLLSTGDAHATNIAVLEAACAGKVMDTGGLISLRIRTDTTGDIVQAFTDADIIDTEAGVWRPSLPLSERWNQGRGSFVDPRALYRITPLPEPVRDATYEAEDGWKRPGPEFRFDAVQDPDQAQKLIRLELNISRYMGVFTAPFNWRAKKVRIWDIVTLTSANDGFEDKLFRVLEKKTDPMGAIWLLLREDDPSIYAGGTVNPVPAPSPGAGYDPRTVTEPDAADWTVTPAYIEGGGAKIPTLLVTGGTPAANIVAVHARFRLGVSGNWVYQGRFGAGQAIRIDRAALAPGQPYYVELVYENAYGVRSSPTVIGPNNAPADFVALSSLLSDSFVGQGALATLNEVTWATQVTGTGKPEDYATQSRVFRQDTAPSSPNTNDIWVQTSGGSPIAVRAWNGSAWVTGADITLINTAAAIAGQGWGATASESAASNALKPGSNNAAIDSSFEQNFTFWNNLFTSAGTWLNQTFFSGGKKYLQRYNAAPPAGAQANLFASDLTALPVTVGERVEVSALQSYAGFTTVYLAINWLDSSRAYLATTNVLTNPTNFARVGGFGTAPTGAAFAQLGMYGTGATGAEAFIQFTEPLIRVADSLQTALTPYTPGPPDLRADRTADGTAAAIIGQGALATKNTVSAADIEASARTSSGATTYATISTSGTTWVTCATLDLTVGAGGFLDFTGSFISKAGPVGTPPNDYFFGEWRVTEQLQSGGTEYVVASGNVDFDGTTFPPTVTVMDPEIPARGGVAQNISGAVRYRLQIRRRSGSNDVGGISGRFFVRRTA